MRKDCKHIGKEIDDGEWEDESMAEDAGVEENTSGVPAPTGEAEAAEVSRPPDHDQDGIL